MSVLAVMQNLRSEVDAGSIRPFSFVEINGLKLASPENIYRVTNCKIYIYHLLCLFFSLFPILSENPALSGCI